MAEKFVHGQERHRGVAAATAQAGGEGDLFLQVDANAFAGRDVGGVQKQAGGTIDEVLGVGGKAGVCASQYNHVARPLESQPVKQIDWMQDSFQFMEAVGPLSQDVQQKVDFAG